MAKLSKDEIITKINEKIVDNDDLKVELMEDITDSFVEDKTELNEMTTKYEEMKNKYDDLHNRYVERFMNPSDVEKPVVKDPYEDNKPKVIDIVEI